MRYLVIGGNSIFGTRLIDNLLAGKQTEFVTTTRLPDENEYQRERLEWEVLDLRDVEKTIEVVKNAGGDVIFDLATQDSVGFSWKQPTETVEINVVGTINLLNAVRDYSPKSRLVIGGSGEEYGRIPFSNLPIAEETAPLPVNIYGATKASQTMFAQLYHRAFGLDIVVLRTFYETSVKQNERFAVSSFCKQFAEIEAGMREPVIYTGNLSNSRDFTDVEDLIKAFLLIAEKGKSGEVYNAARGQSTSLLDVIRILENLTGIQVDIRMVAERVRPIDAPSVVADVKKIREDTGWKAVIPVESTVEQLLNFWRKQIGVNPSYRADV